MNEALSNYSCADTDRAISQQCKLTAQQ